MEDRKQCYKIFKVLKQKNLLTKNSILAKLSVKNEVKIKTFANEQKLKEFTTITLALQEILKGVL